MKTKTYQLKLSKMFYYQRCLHRRALRTVLRRSLRTVFIQFFRGYKKKNKEKTSEHSIETSEKTLSQP